MKKITRCALAIGIIFSSCQKEPTYVRNYSQPLYGNDPTGVQRGGNVTWFEGRSDEECVAEIKTFHNYDPSKPIFLNPKAYDLGQNSGDVIIRSAKADYILFPHSINSYSYEWGRGYLSEMRELRSEHGAEGMQMFLDKYLEGDSTLGMKLNKRF